MSIGYVGLGNMGGALARRLLLTHPLHVHDVNDTAAQRLSNLGAKPCASGSEVAAQCDTVLLCLPTSAEVRSAIFGANGLGATARRGTLIVDQTTGDPTATRAMAAELAPRGIELIDAPVSGGPRGADAGTIAIMVGATEAQYARILPVLHAISPNVFHAGEVGCGQVVKLANNMISAGQRLLSFEAMALAVKNGVTPERAADIIMARLGTELLLRAFHALAHHHRQDRVRLHPWPAAQGCPARDPGRRGLGMPMLFGNLVREFYQMCIGEYGSNAEVNTAALLMDRLAGTYDRPGRFWYTE